MNPVEQIKERLDIVEVIGTYLKLAKAGQNYKARCPFHNEKTPSFMISPSRQTFYCFGCEAHGDIFSFVERFEGLDFKGALKILADKAGVKLKSWKPGIQEKNTAIYEIMEKSAQFFADNLKKDKFTLSYLQKRGINPESSIKWRLGLALDEWRSLHDMLTSTGSKKEDLLTAGVIKKTGDKYYDTFRGRLMFPIFDSSGKTIAFSGRILADKDNAPKYVNSPETPIFYKSEVLYGLNLAKEAIRKLNYSVLVEGQIDLVLSHQAGVVNTVASSGTAITELHLKRLQKISNRIIIAYDADDAGRRAAERAAEIALALGMEVKIASLKEGEDPASVVKKDPEEWKKYLRNAVDAVEYKLNNTLAKKLNGVALAKKIYTDVVPLVALVGNEMLKSEYIALISRRTGIKQEAITQEVNKKRAIDSQKNEYSRVLKEDSESEDYLNKDESLSARELLAGIILWQANTPRKDQIIDIKIINEKIDKLFGNGFINEVLGSKDWSEDTLATEARKKVEELEPAKILDEVLVRLESEVLKSKFEETARYLDEEEDKAKKEKIRKKMAEISTQLSNLNK